MKRELLPDNYELICTAFQRSGGEMSGEVIDLLTMFDLTADSKADPIAALIRDFEEQKETWKKEADRASAHRRVADTAVESLKDWLLLRLDALGVKKIEGSRFVVAEHQNSQPSIEWKGKGAIPKAFQKIEVKLDSAKARVAFAAKKLPRGFFAFIGRHVRISGA